MSSELISIFNEEGTQIGTKPKGEIDKKKDIFQVVYVRIFIGDKILLTKIVKKEGGIGKINEGKWGLPVATILRLDETPKDAFQRACLSDVGEVPQVEKILDRNFLTFQSSSPRIVFAYESSFDKVPVREGIEHILVQSSELRLMYEKGILAETALIFEQ